jgi:hypothetical protein
MRGGRKQAKPDCGRPLDGRVRPLGGALHRAGEEAGMAGPGGSGESYVDVFGDVYSYVEVFGDV